MALEAEEITGAVIGAAYEVYNTLRYGYLESVYQNAMTHELRLRGLQVEPQPKIRVFYKNVEVGYFLADHLVEEQVVVELKVAADYCKADEAQLINELRGAKRRVGLLINFGRAKVEFRRLVV